MAATLAIESLPTKATETRTSGTGNTRERVLGWFARAQLRRELARLDDRLLSDIGFDPVQARHEAEKPVWKAYTLTRLPA